MPCKFDLHDKASEQVFRFCLLVVFLKTYCNFKPTIICLSGILTTNIIQHKKKVQQRVDFLNILNICIISSYVFISPLCIWFQLSVKVSNPIDQHTLRYVELYRVVHQIPLCASSLFSPVVVYYRVKL